MGKGHIQYLRRRIAVWWSPKALAFVLVLFFIFAYLFEHQTLIMGIEDFEVWFCIVYLVLSLNGRKKCFKLNQSTAFLSDINNLTDPSEVRENVVKAVMVVVLGQRSHEQYFRRAVFYQKLFRIRVDQSFGLPTIYLNRFLPFSKLTALKSKFSELFIHIHKVVEGVALL